MDYEQLMAQPDKPEFTGRFLFILSDGTLRLHNEIYWPHIRQVDEETLKIVNLDTGQQLDYNLICEPYWDEICKLCEEEDL